MNILVYSSQYRLPNEAYGAPFTEQLVRAMQKLPSVTGMTVVCPVPWYPRSRLFRFNPDWSKLAAVPHQGVVDGVAVLYPKYLMVPKISGAVQPWLLAAASFGAIKALHASRKIDVINARWIYPDGVAAVWMGRRLGIPVVLTALGCDINLYSNYYVRGVQIRWALRRADHVTAVSRPLVDKIVSLGVSPDRVTCEPNGVDLDRFDSQKRKAANELAPSSLAPNYLLAVARLSEEKGIGNLVRALGLLKQRNALKFRTVIVGDGPDRRSLLADVGRLDLNDHVTFIGSVPHSQVDAWMRNAHALCLPSLREGMPNVVLEALATGIPVVASRVGGIPDVIDDTSGVMVPPGDIESLATALHAVFTRQWDASQVRARVAHLSWRNAAAVQLEIFEKISIGMRQQGAK